MVKFICLFTITINGETRPFAKDFNATDWNDAANLANNYMFNFYRLNNEGGGDKIALLQITITA